MNSKCKGCNKEILDDEEKAVVWEKRDKGLFISFYHIKCIPDGAEDITSELKGPKGPKEDSDEENPTQVLPDQL